MAKRILIVEDETHLAEGLAFNLEAEGYAVDIEGDGAQAVQRIHARPRPDLVLLDVMLPGRGGFEIARRVRAGGNFIPILMLTAKDAPADIVRGIEEGADDYLTKPFALEELLARVRALLRRRRWDGARKNGRPPERFGGVTVHFDRLQIAREGGGTVQLTPREAGLLHALMESEGEIISRGALLQKVWGLRAETRTRVVDQFVLRLRRYVESDPANPRHIQSVRGSGYRFVRGALS